MSATVMNREANDNQVWEIPLPEGEFDKTTDDDRIDEMTKEEIINRRASTFRSTDSRVTSFQAGDKSTVAAANRAAAKFNASQNSNHAKLEAVPESPVKVYNEASF